MIPYLKQIYIFTEFDLIFLCFMYMSAGVHLSAGAKKALAPL